MTPPPARAPPARAPPRPRTARAHTARPPTHLSTSQNQTLCCVAWRRSITRSLDLYSSPDAVSSLLLPAGQVQPGTALGPAAQLFPLFLGKHAFHRRCLDGTIGPDQIANETKAQLDLFEQLCGFRPITADG